MTTIQDLLNATSKVYEGMKRFETEKQIKSYVLSVYKSQLGKFSFKGDIVAGERASIGEGDATDYRLKEGDSIILDLLPRKDGISADTTRTFFVGQPTEEQVVVYNTVRKALEQTEKILKPKIKACDIYNFMKEQLKPFENTFFHHAGHLIGFRRMLQPQFLPNKVTSLMVGDVVTLEPGIYVKGKFGVRLENNYLITESGCEKLFDYPLDIEKFILK
jgi:Xaa-Pro aminopeptidase